MSNKCRLCNKEMPKDRQGWEQICGKCLSLLKTAKEETKMSSIMSITSKIKTSEKEEMLEKVIAMAKEEIKEWKKFLKDCQKRKDKND